MTATPWRHGLTLYSFYGKGSWAVFLTADSLRALPCPFFRTVAELRGVRRLGRGEGNRRTQFSFFWEKKTKSRSRSNFIQKRAYIKSLLACAIFYLKIKGLLKIKRN